MSLLLPLQFHHLFPLDDEAVIHHTVLVVVAQEPAIELAPPLDHLEEVRQPVRGVALIQLLLDAGGGQWVRTQFTRQLILSRFLTASSYSSSEGISWGHQETPFTRNICRVRRLNQYRLL